MQGTVKARRNRLAGGLLASSVIAAAILTACLGRAQQRESFAIAWSYDTSGYLETCGCSAAQLGGLGRRATKIAQLREKQPLLALEGAHIVEDKGGFQLFKGQMIVAALNSMDYSGLQLGLREAQQGAEGIRQLTEKAAFPCFSANLVVDSEPWKTASARVEIAGQQVGVTGVSQPEAVSFELPEGVGFSDPRAALDAQLAALRKDCDFCIVCLEGEQTWVDEMKRVFSAQAELFLSGVRDENTATLDYSPEPPALNVWDKGRFMGLLTVDPASGGDGYTISGASLPLTDDLKADAGVQSILDNEYKPHLKEMFFDTFKGDLTQLFLPPEYCADCHKKEYDQYLTTKHALAMQTLVDKGQLYNPDCMKCHVTYDSKEDKLYSMNCVVCHTNITEDHVWQAVEGPEHVVKPETPATTYTYDWCYRCHDELNSANFKNHWPQYVNKVFHGGDITEAKAAAADMGIDMLQPPPAHH